MFKFLFYFLVMYLFYFYSQYFFGFILKNKKKLNIYSISIIFTTLQFLLTRILQEDEYSMYVGAMFIVFLFLFTINIVLFKFYYKISVSIFNFLLLIYCIAQRYVFLFKGAAFTIEDLSALDTALGVAGNYDYTPTKGIIFGIVFFIIMEIILFRVNFSQISLKKYLIIFLISLLSISGILGSFAYNKRNIEKIGAIKLHDPESALSHYGSLLNLYINYLYAEFVYPEDYNETKVIEELDSVFKTNNFNENKKQAVNIICILSESLYDFNLIKDINPSSDFMSYWNSLKENTIKGNTIVSSFGGGTANSEWEFLTNGNCLFIPPGIYPFTKYINEETYSFARTLKDLNYRTIVYHPYEKDFWNREMVYPLLGFEEYYAFLDKYNETTDSKLIRGLMSDKGNYEEIIKMYEEKESGENLFVYNVTIQNHSGYEGTPEIITIEEFNYNSKGFNTYLSLLNESDEALKYLIEYFDKIDEPTLICVFGDHIPGKLLNLQENFDKNNLKESLKYYTTPFLIHTNYDIEETDYYDGISLSYLSTLVMDYANLPKTKEQMFIQSFMNEYPIVNKYVYGSKNNLNLGKNLNDDLKLWRDYCYMNLSPKK